MKVEATSPNVPPNADAGPDQNAFLGDVVELDASASHDPDGGPETLAFQWRFFAVPGTSVLEDADISAGDAPFAEFTPDVAGSYAVDVEVDDGLDSDSDTVEIVVELPNVPPNADAGDDAGAVLGELVTLDGSGSDDPDDGPDPLAYAWRFVSIPAGSSLTNADIADADTAEPTFAPDVPGAYVLELAVDDGEDADFDNAMVEVLPPNLPEPVFDLVARAKPGEDRPRMDARPRSGELRRLPELQRGRPLRTDRRGLRQRLRGLRGLRADERDPPLLCRPFGRRGRAAVRRLQRSERDTGKPESLDDS